MAGCSFRRIRISVFLLSWWVTPRDQRAHTPLPLSPCLLYYQKAVFLRWGYWNLSVRYRPMSRYVPPPLCRGPRRSRKG